MMEELNWKKFSGELTIVGFQYFASDEECIWETIPYFV